MKPRPKWTRPTMTALAGATAMAIFTGGPVFYMIIATVSIYALEDILRLPD